MHQGIPARYDISVGDQKKRDLMKSPRYRSKERMGPLLQCLRPVNLRKAQKSMRKIAYQSSIPFLDKSVQLQSVSVRILFFRNK